MKCPKCGFEQPDDIFCARCGVDVEKWRVSSRRKKRNFLRIVVVGGVLAVFVGVLISLLGGEKNKSSSLTETLTTTDVNQPEEAPTEGTSTLPLSPNAPSASQNAKPLPEESFPSSFTQNAVIEIIPPADVLTAEQVRKMRVYVAKNRQMIPATFQVDCGWAKNCPEVGGRGLKLLIASSELGDRDDSSSPPAGFANFWRAEARQGNSRGWAYVYLFDYPPTIPQISYITFSPSLDKISGKNYKLAWSEDPPVITELSVGADSNLLDRQKIRLSVGDSTLTENDLKGKFEVITTGPLLARSRWAGVMTKGEALAVPVIIENEFLPFGFSSHYEMDFSNISSQSAVLKIYLDFKPLRNLKLGIGAEENATIDGKPDEFRYDIGLKNFSIHTQEGFIFLSVSSSLAQLFYKDDASFADSPETQPGCYGCAGFEIPANGTIEFTITYTISDTATPRSPLKIPAQLISPAQ